MEHIENDPAPIGETSPLSLSKKASVPVVPFLNIPTEASNPPIRRTRSWKELKDSPKAILREISHFSPGSPRALKDREKQATQLTGPYFLRKPSQEIAKASDQLRLESRQDLSKRLAGKSGYPWEDIAATCDADLIESLLNLYRLALKVYPQGSTAESVMMIAFEIINKSKRKTALGGENGKSYALAIIGMLIDYVTTEPVGASKLAGGKEYQESIDKIKSKFKQRIESTHETLKKIYVAHSEAGLQNPELACIKQIPNEIAKLLMPVQGLINFGVIGAIKEAFVKEDNPLNYQINLYYGLAHLKYHYELRDILSKIKKPLNEKDPSHFVIRSTQGISMKDPVSELDAQRTALSALLSHLRQHPTEDSCFTTSIAIELMTFNLGCCAKDFSELLETSKLTRKVNGKVIDFPFVPHMNGESANKLLKFDGNGRIIDGMRQMGFLWDAPGIKGACQAIGIDDPKTVIKQVYLNKGGAFIRRNNFISLRDFLLTMANHPTASKEYSPNELFNRACFLYDSLTSCHPLLRVWENSLAGMSEARETSIMKAAISDSVVKVIRDYAKLVANDLKWEESEFEKMMIKELQNQGHLQYDPEIEKRGPLNGSQCVRGAFVLYQQSPAQSSLKRMRIDTPELYQEFLKIILESTIHKIPKSERANKTNEPYIRFMTDLAAYVQSELFISANLECYHEENLKLIENSIDYEKLRYTPWITRIGNNPKALLKVYYEIDKLPDTEIFQPKTEMDLLCKFINLRRDSTPRTKDLARNPFYLQPVRRPGMHAFSALAGELSIPANISTVDWIDRSIVRPGLEVAFALLQSGQRDELIKYITSRYSDAAAKHSMERTLKHVSLNTTIKEFRDFILSLVSKIEGMNSEINAQFERDLDHKIYTTLPKELKTKLENASFQVADSNMPEGINDVRYCFTVNPGTGGLSFWACLDNKTLLNLLDAKQWLLNQSWEFYRHPQNANESPRLN